MIKFKLKRKMSGDKIRKAKRQERLLEEKVERRVRFFSSNIKKSKRHTENPNRYNGEEGVYPLGSFYSARLPKKARKTAWKRFKKNFPNVKVSRYGTKIFVPTNPTKIKPLEPILNPMPKKKIN